MLIDKLMEEWSIDCVIDDEDIGGAALRTPNLHAKYLKILIDYKLKKAKGLSDMSTLRSLKSKYFRGLLTTDELKELGLDPYPFRVLKGEVDELIDADAAIQKIQNKLEYYNSAIYLLESILQEIKSRFFHTRVAMYWVRFRAGG